MIEKYPLIKEVINPKSKGVISVVTVEGSEITFSEDNMTAPLMAGIAIRKEYSAAFSRSIPVSKAAVKVDPERDTPGMIATH